jgi:hypothetical protein
MINFEKKYKISKEEAEKIFATIHGYRITDIDGTDWGIWFAESREEALKMLLDDMVYRPSLYGIGYAFPGEDGFETEEKAKKFIDRLLSHALTVSPKHSTQVMDYGDVFVI